MAVFMVQSEDFAFVIKPIGNVHIHSPRQSRHNFFGDFQLFYNGRIHCPTSQIDLSYMQHF